MTNKRIKNKRIKNKRINIRCQQNINISAFSNNGTI